MEREGGFEPYRDSFTKIRKKREVLGWLVRGIDQEGGGLPHLLSLLVVGDGAFSFSTSFSIFVFICM